MKLSELQAALVRAWQHVNQGEDPDVVLSFEPTALEEGFDWQHTEGISDVRLVNAWALPGESMMIQEGVKPSKVIIFYDNHFALDSSAE